MALKGLFKETSLNKYAYIKYFSDVLLYSTCKNKYALTDHNFETLTAKLHKILWDAKDIFKYIK